GGRRSGRWGRRTPRGRACAWRDCSPGPLGLQAASCIVAETGGGTAMDEVFDHGWAHIAVTRRETVCEVALARTEARNALNGELMGELTEVARRLRLRTDVLAVVLTGTERYFSAGADISASQARAAAPTMLQARAAIAAGP